MADESLIEFPTRFPIKALGANEAGFRELVLELVGKHAEFDADADVKESSSSNERFISVTVTMMAENQEQLDTIYQSLHDHELVLMVF